MTGPVTLIIRQEAFHRALDGGVMAIVTQARSLGREQLLGLRIGALELTARWGEGRLPAVGDRIPVVVDRHRVHLFPKET